MVDRAWLEAALAEAAGGGTIADIRVTETDAMHSRILHLELVWEGAAATAPARIVWKRGLDGDREVDVYRLLKTRSALPTPRCFAADDQGVLLEDLSRTHHAPVSRDELLAGRGVPSGDAIERVVDALADFHAAWWEDPALGTGVAEVRDWFRDPASHGAHVERRRRELDRFLQIEPESPHRDVYREALAVLGRLWTPEWAARMTDHTNLTLVQGDAYPNQFLVPGRGDGPAIVMDFGDATANPGAFDLAFLLATFWTRGQRAEDRREDSLLERYADRLSRRGVHFPVELVRADYRRMVAYLVFDALWNCTDGSSRGYWEPKMNCLVAAWEDWDCASLPGSPQGEHSHR